MEDGEFYFFTRRLELILAGPRGRKQKRSEQTSIALCLLRPGGTLLYFILSEELSFLSGVIDAHQVGLHPLCHPGTRPLNS